MTSLSPPLWSCPFCSSNFAPNPRDWRVVHEPAGSTGTVAADLRRLAVLAGVLLTPAFSPWDPRAWFALYRYSTDFPMGQLKLRPYNGIASWPSRLKGVFAEELSVGVAAHIAIASRGARFLLDAEVALELKLVERVPGSTSKQIPDYFVLDSALEGSVLEVKGAIGTRSSLKGAISTGVGQISNVRVKVPPSAKTHGCVIATHFCVDGMHPRSETTSVVWDVPPPALGPGSPPSIPVDPADSNPVAAMLRAYFLKAVNFAQLGTDSQLQRKLEPADNAGRLVECRRGTRQIAGLRFGSFGTNTLGWQLAIADDVLSPVVTHDVSSDPSVQSDLAEAVRAVDDALAGQDSAEGGRLILPGGVVLERVS